MTSIVTLPIRDYFERKAQGKFVFFFGSKIEIL
jgi:hypothetical protein